MLRKNDVRIFWKWCIGNKAFITTALDGRLCIYEKTPDSGEPEGFRLSLICYGEDTATYKVLFKYAMTKLTVHCYAPSIEYDYELDQWQITLHSWTSGCSKDSPVRYCKDEAGLEYAIFDAIIEIIQREKLNT